MAVVERIGSSLRLMAYENARSRSTLWTLLLLLSFCLVFYPTQLDLVMAPIQSIYLIPHLSVFGTIFYIWLGLIVILLYFGRSQESTWTQLALVCLFTTTFSAIWVLPAGGQMRESLQYAAQLDFLKEHSHIAFVSPNFRYFAWPGVFFMTSMLAQVTNISTFTSQLVVIIVVINCLLSVFLYLLYLRVTRDRQLASMGVLLTIIGNTMLTKLLQQFHPGTFGVALFVLALAILVLMTTSSNNNQHAGILIPIVACITVSHMMSSIAVLLVLAGIMIVYVLARRGSIISYPKLATVSALFSIAWLAFFAVVAGQDLSRTIAGGLRVFLSGGIVGAFPARLATTYVGQASPEWATLVRVLWLAVVLGLGGVAGFRLLLKVRRLSERQVIIVGGSVGVWVLGLLAFVVSEGTEAVRFFTYFPFFAVAALLDYVHNGRPRARRYATRSFALFVFILGFPGFLANNNTVSFNIMNRPPERAAGSFLQSKYGLVRELEVYGTEFYDFVYFMPFATYRHLPVLVIGLRGETAVTRVIGQEIINFIGGSNATGKAEIWVSTKRTMLDIYFLSGVNLEGKAWSDLENSLSSSANRAYANGQVHVYLPTLRI